MEAIRVPDQVLPAPGRRELPEPVPLRRMLGPSVILAGLSIGSGELVLWPRLTAEWGFAVFWACWVGVTIQFFLNMEIERWTLATGESAVTGFLRLGRAWGPVFLACGTIPWMWPGWATGGSTILAWELGGNVTAYTVGSLAFCGVVLTVSPVVYRAVELLQMILVTAIFLFLGILAVLVVRGDALAALAAGALRFGHLPPGIDVPLLLGALAFAGAGGTANLAQSNYIKDKGYGMGCWMGRITSPFTGRDEAATEIGYVFPPDTANLARWKVWWRRANLEHFFTFWLLCNLSLVLLCLLAYSLLEPGAPVSQGFGFIADQAATLERRFGPGARHLFLGAALAVLFSTELGLLDAVSRVAADVVKVSFLSDRRAWTPSRIYVALVWSMVALGIAIVLGGFDQPLSLLVLSSCLNGFVMFLYSGLLLWLNLTTFSGPLRPSPVRVAALAGSLIFFGYFSALTLADQLSR
ncbi:MAG: hypothetical protein QOD06_953 [Candidatus Binatota bacterium]|nr:hypothetical protein [Candidatus Binatota bacterium]